MGRLCSPYRGYDKSEIKARADIPTQSNIDISYDDADCTNISLNAVATLVSDSTKSLKESCLKANKWSGFSPSHKSYTDSGTLSGVLRNELEAPYSLGAFAGYNHDAITPSLDHFYWQEWILSGETATVDVYVNLGEFNYPSPAVGLALTLWDGSTLVGFGITALSGTEGTNTFVTAQTGTLTANKTIIAKVFIVDSTTEFAQNGANVCCKAYGVSDASKEIKIIQASTFTVSAGSFTVVGAGIDYTNGRVSFTSASSATYTGDLIVVADLIRYDGQNFEEIEMYNGTYTANDTLYPSTNPAQFSLVPIPLFGYTIALSFNEAS